MASIRQAVLPAQTTDSCGCPVPCCKTATGTGLLWPPALGFWSTGHGQASRRWQSCAAFRPTGSCRTCAVVRGFRRLAIQPGKLTLYDITRSNWRRIRPIGRNGGTLQQAADHRRRLLQFANASQLGDVGLASLDCWGYSGCFLEKIGRCGRQALPCPDQLLAMRPERSRRQS